MTKRSIAVSAMLALVFICGNMLAIRVAVAETSDQAKQIGGKFMCMCGCNQILAQCNHVGCPVSASMMKELEQSLTRGDSETVITQMFVQEFGTRVYAEPPKSGFSLVAWLMPGFYLLFGTILVVFVILRWSKRPSVQMAGGPSMSGISPEILERARARASQETQD